ncbi:MAG: hypothetical protein K9I69_03060 [Ignavibacteriales bacterium]|nr:hypothetical protein [Ignavibacteriales bacterium]MCF8316566.1 hypothetical protein [Ignavibacteriales bacterium]MCF8437489.1 hypothetical protein [Ignavibacteriales bacterium]
MKITRPIYRLLLLPLLFLSAVGCEQTTEPENTPDPEKSKELSDQAYAQVETQMNNMLNGEINSISDMDQYDFATALDLYDQAVTLDENNTDAHFGAALTEVLAAYSDPEIKQLIKDIDSSASSFEKRSKPVRDLLSATILPRTTRSMSFTTTAAAGGILFTLQNAMKDPPLISRVQSVLKNNFLPKVQSAINHLSKLDSDESFRFNITGKMQGDPSLNSVTVYPTEAALMNAMMHGIKFNIQAALIYSFELSDYTQSSLLTALNQNNTTFFVLGSTGKQTASDAKTTFNTIITKIEKGIDYLERISGSKSDAIIKLGHDGVEQVDLDTLKTYLNKIETALSQNHTVTIKDADTDGNDYTVQVNLGNFFANPPPNPKKDWLPPYTVTPHGSEDIHLAFDAETYAEFNFPDPTFGGLLPGMQQETIKRIMHIDEEFAFVLEGYISLYPNDYYSYQGEGITLKVTFNNQTYSTVTEEWGWFSFFLRDAGTTAQPITKFAVVQNGVERELINLSPAPFAGVKAKEWVWCNIRLPRAVSNLTAQKNYSPAGIRLNWFVDNLSYSYEWESVYKIERKISGGSYILPYLSIDYPYFSALDMNVESGVQYTYRLRTYYPEEQGDIYYWSDLFLVLKNPVYSNEVTITY